MGSLQGKCLPDHRELSGNTASERRKDMPGLLDFTTQTFSPRVITRKAASYTVLVTDELIQVNGTYTMTLPPLDSLQGTTYARKVYKFQNVHATSTATIQPGTSAVTNVADTINGKASFALKPNEEIIIGGSEAATDWAITSPTTLPALTRASFSKVATTNGTTAVNIFDANGAPDNIVVDLVLATAHTTTGAGNITIKNGTDTLVTIAKSTTNYVTMGMVPAGFAAIAKGAICTCVTDGSDATVVILGSAQKLV
jgi:hypothetical protein